MKNIVWILMFGLLLSNEIDAQENSAQKAYNLGYAYGGHLGMSLEFLDLAMEEKDVDKFVEGFEDGLTIDSASFAAAKKILEDRLKRREPSKTLAEAHEVAYYIGVNSIGGLILQLEILPTDFDLNALKEGFSEGVLGNVSKMTREEMDSIMNAYFDPRAEKYKAKMESNQKLTANQALEEGTKFLAENKKKADVITTASGLQYEIIKKGKGRKVKSKDKVKVHYHGNLINGFVFDSSIDRGEPSTFLQIGLIKGWQEGLALMNKGAKYRFFIPQELAYGMESPNGQIPAGSALIFEVELLEIVQEKKNKKRTITEKDLWDY